MNADKKEGFKWNRPLSSDFICVDLRSSAAITRLYRTGAQLLNLQGYRVDCIEAGTLARVLVPIIEVNDSVR